MEQSPGVNLGAGGVADDLVLFVDDVKNVVPYLGGKGSLEIHTVPIS